MGESIDGRADQYALGATAFHLLTGHPVFDYSNPAVVISRHLNAAPPPLSDRRSELAALDSVVRRALAKDPGDRFACCADFAQELRATAERTEGLGDDTGRSARTQVVSGSTVSPTAPTQLAPISAGLNTEARSAAPAKPTTGSQRLILVGAAGAVALIAVIASIALWPRGVQSNSPAESADPSNLFADSASKSSSRCSGSRTAIDGTTSEPPFSGPDNSQVTPCCGKHSFSLRVRFRDYTIRQNRLPDPRGRCGMPSAVDRTHTTAIWRSRQRRSGRLEWRLGMGHRRYGRSVIHHTELRHCIPDPGLDCHAHQRRHHVLQRHHRARHDRRRTRGQAVLAFRLLPRLAADNTRLRRRRLIWPTADNLHPSTRRPCCLVAQPFPSADHASSLAAAHWTSRRRAHRHRFYGAIRTARSETVRTARPREVHAATH